MIIITADDKNKIKDELDHSKWNLKMEEKKKQRMVGGAWRTAGATDRRSHLTHTHGLCGAFYVLIS